MSDQFLSLRCIVVFSSQVSSINRVLRNLSSSSTTTTGLKPTTDYHSYQTREFHYDGSSCNLLNPPPIWTVLGAPNPTANSSHPWPHHPHHHPHQQAQLQQTHPSMTTCETSMRALNNKSNQSASECSPIHTDV